MDQKIHDPAPLEQSIRSPKQTISQLLNVICPQISNQSDSMTTDPNFKIDHCIKLVKAMTSLAASLIADSALQRSPILAQAKKQIKILERLKLLGLLVTQSDHY